MEGLEAHCCQSQLSFSVFLPPHLPLISLSSLGQVMGWFFFPCYGISFQSLILFLEVFFPSLWICISSRPVLSLPLCIWFSHLICENNEHAITFREQGLAGWLKNSPTFNLVTMIQPRNSVFCWLFGGWLLQGWKFWLKVALIPH